MNISCSQCLKWNYLFVQRYCQEENGQELFSYGIFFLEWRPLLPLWQVVFVECLNLSVRGKIENQMTNLEAVLSGRAQGMKTQQKMQFTWALLKNVPLLTRQLNTTLISPCVTFFPTIMTQPSILIEKAQLPNFISAKRIIPEVSSHSRESN